MILRTVRDVSMFIHVYYDARSISRLNSKPLGPNSAVWFQRFGTNLSYGVMLRSKIQQLCSSAIYKQNVYCYA